MVHVIPLLTIYQIQISRVLLEIDFEIPRTRGRLRITIFLFRRCECFLSQRGRRHRSRSSWHSAGLPCAFRSHLRGALAPNTKGCAQSSRLIFLDKRGFKCQENIISLRAFLAPSLEHEARDTLEKVSPLKTFRRLNDGDAFRRPVMRLGFVRNRAFDDRAFHLLYSRLF